MKKEKGSSTTDEGQLNMSTSPAREGSANAGSANGLEEKPRLSEHEKKANHIASGMCYAVVDVWGSFGPWVHHATFWIGVGFGLMRWLGRAEEETSYP
jgi:hypothetical protein